MAKLSGSLGLSQFERTIGRKPDLVIPYMKGVLRQAADLGEPAVAKHGPFARAMRTLAFRAASVSETGQSQRRRLWRWR